MSTENDPMRQLAAAYVAADGDLSRARLPEGAKVPAPEEDPFYALDGAVTDYRSRLQTDKERHLLDKVMNEHGFNYVPDPTEYEEEA